MNDVVAELEKRRLELGLNHAQVARNVQPPMRCEQVSRILRGRVDPRLETLSKLAGALGCAIVVFRGR